jgi:ArsR family transcriptional regulator
MLDHIYAYPYITRMKLDAETLFRLLADTTRLRAVMLLQQAGELCVCELTHALDLSQPKISRHLAHLRESGLLLTRRNGLWMYYRINPALPDWTQGILQATLAGNAANRPFIADQQALAGMPNRPDAACCA